jgi:3-hydroxy-9,10-secoandrosta-1,3,5(10)-triene-9,17-dione monooxygenase reductase component
MHQILATGRVTTMGAADNPSPPAIDPGHFRQVLGHFPTGVTVITATDPDGQDVGLAVGSFFSISLDPPLVGFCPAKTSSSYPRIEAAGHFVVNILGEDQQDVCSAFASSQGNKFEGLDRSPAPATGGPVLDGVLGWIDCRLETVHDAGDHWIVVGRVQELDVPRDGRPLVFFRGGFGRFTTD